MTISVSSVSKYFYSHAALDGVSINIEKGEFFVVLGPSGCGKSTLLRSIAGLETIDGGEIHLAGHHVAGKGTHVPPEKRNVGVVFQSYALWPHMSVSGNVAFPLETARLAKNDIAAQTRNCLERVELLPYADRKPADLSGGQRQRVALARCLAQGAQTVLMDEPLANLDPHLRHAMEEELSDFHRATGATTLFITHDQREAMALADRVALMWDGKVLQVDHPHRLYSKPKNERVASFIGRGSLVDVVVKKADRGLALIAFSGVHVPVRCAENASEGDGQLLIRPEQIVVSPDGDGISGRVARVTYRGGFWEVHVQLNASQPAVLVNTSRRVTEGDKVSLRIEDAWLLPE
ncbi:iron(III) transport system ATP-binding protein [Roseibium hamelinense]|uniref:Iron(III) transport system ATP-binding protein n=1 Tax=Roseibium hamelinense TaxID=150831 RepID=A0A562SM48_9HYPH|nr:ABC transporter ATP-binding protein [Roseibium hamelinense]MTI42258.1 ABC transporter ATP-binding protein [Roseibium hamelinense]TWI82153.1 iron(III) transport system ATP-binding protein [Roseibium hamelinense]